MEHPVEEVVEERRQSAMDVRMLAAGMAEVADQLGTAVKAFRFLRVPVRAFAGLGFYRSADNAAADRIADCLEFADHALPFQSPHYAVRRPAC
jgi:hypothetical protein